MTLLIVGGLFAVALLAMVAVYFVAQSEKQAELKKAAAAAQAEAEVAPQEAEAVAQPEQPVAEEVPAQPIAEEASAQPVVEEVPAQPVVVEKATTPVASSVVLEPGTDIYGANSKAIYGDNPYRERLSLSTELRSLHSQVQEMEQRLSVLNEVAQRIEGTQEPEPRYLVAVSEDEFEKYDNSFDDEEEAEITERLAVVRKPITEDIAR